MRSTIIYLLGSSLFFLAIEFLMLGAFRASPSDGKARAIRTICRVILGTVIIAYLLLMGLFLYAGADMILHGDSRQGLSVLASGVIVGICVYFWLIRGWIRQMRKDRS